jgi:hypothetical protein
VLACVPWQLFRAGSTARGGASPCTAHARASRASERGGIRSARSRPPRFFRLRRARRSTIRTASSRTTGGLDLIDRRTFLRAGAGALALGLSRRAGLGLVAAHEAASGREGRPHSAGAPFPSDPADALLVADSRPLARLPDELSSVLVDGLPFAPWYTGDSFANTAIPFHRPENNLPGGFPSPDEEVEVAIVGGGLSGLTTALLLERFDPVVFEMRPRFGGNAQGESWADSVYSLGGAYFITPDPGTFLDRFYHRLGLHRVVRVDTGDNPVELDGRVVAGFWQGAGAAPEELAGFRRYQEILDDYAYAAYPDIPLVEGGDNAWIRDLDRFTLQDDIARRMGDVPVPPLLAAAIQAYCYSSFGAGWGRISAASGWNFLAAEPYGRWVLPGGNSYIVDAIWRELQEVERRRWRPGRILRGGAKVVDVSLLQGGGAQVTYEDPAGRFRALRARRVVMANSKHIAKHMIRDLEALDPAKASAVAELETTAYLVANLLVAAPLSGFGYDTFFLRDGTYPMDEGEVAARPQFVDVVDGDFARGAPAAASVLTVYWPLPFGTARFSLIEDEGWQNYAVRAAADLRAALPLFGIAERDIRQIRLTRWGHAMPLSAPGLIAEGTLENVRRPLEGVIYFVNQDNWALPAVETCLLEAEIWAAEIERDLRRLRRGP